MNLEFLIFKNGKIKLLALVISFVFWVIILGQKDIVLTKEVPVQYLVDNGLEVQDFTDKVILTLSGKRSSLSRLDSSQLAAILDLRSSTVGPKTVPIRKSALNLPIGVKLMSLEPKSASVYIVGRSGSDN